jgi:hypothetical protein
MRAHKGRGYSHSAAVGKRPKLLSEGETKALEVFISHMVCELKESGILSMTLHLTKEAKRPSFMTVFVMLLEFL